MPERGNGHGNGPGAAVTLRINGTLRQAAEGTSVAAAVMNAGVRTFRRSAGKGGGEGERLSEARGPLCGMGICFECRLTIDGAPHQKSCQILVREGMEVITDE